MALHGQNQHLPYPVIFIHGLNSDYKTWNEMIFHLHDQWGWSYGGNMDFNLNYDGNNFTSVLTEDFHDFENQIVAADFYTINFNVDRDGNFGTGSNLSNQAAITKQGIAVRNAIWHVMNITGRDKVILVGHSMGGLAAREYLQNEPYWVEPNINHHVAKLCTVGTPHGGSNATDGGVFSGTDFSSEAIRDLRTSYDPTGFNKGAFLFGGSEPGLKLLFPLITPIAFYCYDVDCDGNEKNGIIGLNEKHLPVDIAYSCIIGTGDKLQGDGAVSEESADLNNFTDDIIADTFKIEKPSGLPFFSLWHTYLTQQIEANIKNMDEPNYLRYAYNVELGNWYQGNITKQPTNSNTATDIDNYSINLPSAGKLNIQVTGIPVNVFTITIFNNAYRQVSDFINSNGANSINIDIPVNSGGKYYVVLAGSPTPNSWENPYSFKLGFTTSPPPSGSCNTVLYESSGTFNDGSGTSNYSNNTDCSWLIQPQNASSIVLHFNSFATETMNDIVSVYDGSDASYKSLGTYSGNTLPPYFVSSGGSMFVKFTTNGSITAAGWDATYNASVGSSIAPRVPAKMSSYKYWLDNDFSNAITVSTVEASKFNINTLINNAALQRGFHTFSFMARQTGEGYTWTAPVSCLFYYSTNAEPSTYEYWFDSLYNQKTTVAITGTEDFILTNEMLNAAVTQNGFHQINIRVKPNGGMWSPVQSHQFYRQVNTAINTYKYWFDNNDADMKTVTVPAATDSLVITDQLLDASGLSNGFHQFSIAVATVGGTWSSAQSHLFYKIQNPAINGYTYWFDNNYAGRQIVTTAGTDMLIINNELLNASGLSNGFHMVHIGISTVGQTAPRGVQTALFFKRGNDISAVMDVKKIRYWFNSDFSTANELTVSGQNGIIDNILECNSAPAGKNTISYQTMDNGNIWSSIVVDTFINAKCSPPATPTITSKSATTFCQGAVDTLVSSNTAGNQWYLNGVKIDGAINTAYAAATSGVYTVVTRVNNCSSAASAPVPITVNPLPATPVIVWDNSQLSTAVGLATYQWYLNDNLITGANSNVYSPSSSGFYKVEVGNSSGCKAMSAGYNLVFTAVSNITVNGILYSLYPNPATKEATLKLSSIPLSKTTLTLVNSYGQKVLSRIITNQTETIAVDHLPQGYYIIKIESKNHSGILKLIVLR